MIEVELKARIKNLEKVRRKAREIGIFIGKEKKIDDYYTLEDFRHYPKRSLRVREMKGYHQVNFKKRISYSRGVHAKKEVEFKITDLKGFFNLLKDFGFKKWLRKEKETELYKIKDNFHIELNKVTGLGNYIEIEYLCDENNINHARKKVLEVFNKFGLDKKDIIKGGYTKMLWDKYH